MSIEIARQLKRLKLDDMASIIQQVYLALYAESDATRILFDPDKEWTPGTLELVAHILSEYGLKPTTRHCVECGTSLRKTEDA